MSIEFRHIPNIFLGSVFSQGYFDRKNLLSKDVLIVVKNPSSSDFSVKDHHDASVDDTPTVSRFENKQELDGVNQGRENYYETNDDYDCEKKFYQLAEKRLRIQAALDYEKFIESREQKIRKETKRQIKLEEYNNELVKKSDEVNQKAAAKKRARRLFMRFWAGLLLGDDDDESIPKPILGITSLTYPAFVRTWKFCAYRVSGVSAISPVYFDGAVTQFYSYPIVRIRPRIIAKKCFVFYGRYRNWVDQFVKKIIEKRQRGPPFLIWFW